MSYSHVLQRSPVSSEWIPCVLIFIISVTLISFVHAIKYLREPKHILKLQYSFEGRGIYWMKLPDKIDVALHAEHTMHMHHQLSYNSH